MAAFVKHIGKIQDRKVAIIYRKVPDEDHMCLVAYPDTLPKSFHDAIMQVIESEPGQQATDLSDALFRNLLPDGRPILQTMHNEGMIKKVKTNEVVVTPNATSHVRLDELNSIMDSMEAGDEANKKLADLDANAGMEKNVANQMYNPAVTADLSDEGIAAERLAQSNKLVSEAEAMLAESKRLQAEAYDLDSSLKPKKTAKKKATKKKTAKKKATKKAAD